MPLFRVQESVAGSVQNFYHSLKNDLGLADVVKSSHILGIKEELWKLSKSDAVNAGRGWWFQLSQDNTKEGRLGDSRKIEPNKMRERFMTWVGAALGGGAA